MPPTRNLSRSKQNTSESENTKTDKSDVNEVEKAELKTNSVDSDTKNEAVDDDEIAEDNQEDKNRRKRPRRSTASSAQLDNDLNDIANKKTKDLDQVSSPSTRKSAQLQTSPEKKESDIKLRRRDKIRGTERYSPEIHEPVRRSKRPLSFPSTSASQNKYINYEGFEDEQSLPSQTTANTTGPQLLPTKKMLLKRSANAIAEDQNSTSTNESKTYLVNLKREENELILVMRDGRTLKIEKPPTTNKRAKSSKHEDEDYEMDESNEEDDDNDEDYEGIKSTRSNKRKAVNKNVKSKTIKLDNSHHESDEHSSSTTEKKVQATGIKMTKQIRKATKQQLMNSKLVDDTRTTRITTPTGSGKLVTFITTPKSVTVTPTNTYSKNPNIYAKRNYGSNAKYLNEIPDLNECTLEEVNPDMAILPDKILLVNSDLPLEYSLQNVAKDNAFLFTQIISAMSEGFKCLLCAITPSSSTPSSNTTPLTKTPIHTFKDEDELVEHYKQFHELNVEQQSAKFSEDTVFVCLPKSIIIQINSEETGSSLILDAPCQYCGDEQKLATVDDMREHYKNAHAKEIKIVEQEEILEMYENLFCSICQTISKDFKSHYKHMKDEHKMQTYICKQCPFFSMVAHRLVTHYRAKHLMSNKNQNLQCSFCNGILIGTDRMNKHIMTSHCVQTGEKEYSCMLCLQPCEKSDQLLAHSYQCQRKYNETMAATHKQEKMSDQQVEESNLDANNDDIEHQYKCFLCDKSFKVEDTLFLHLNHVHTKWTSTVIVNDTFLMVQHNDGKTDLMPKKTANNELEQININDLPTNKELEEIGAKTQYGYYCSKCECVIKIYQLFYLHMHNFHHMTKQFECKITSCKKTFKTHESFKEHLDLTKHPQKSVIENPLLSIACHNCDSYFIDNKDIETHLLSDDHYNKVSKNADRSGMKSEARNYKCKTCHTWFGLFDSFLFHMENESHTHGCPHCGLHFALPSSRRTHIQSTHSDRADICELCSEKQGTKERLFAHLVTHNLVFECNKCMRKFYQREQLNNHMETHGEPLNCPWPKCERKVNRTALSNHIRQHKIENLLKCYACDKLFQTKSQLLAHVEIHNTAEQNAKAILATANSSASKSGKAGQINNANHQSQKPRMGQLSLNTSLSNSSQPVETTLISITTASTNKQRTYGNRSLSNSINKLNNNNLISNKSQLTQQIVNSVAPLPTTNKYQIEKVNTNSTGKIACFTCNQLFTNHQELSEHKCSINKPVVTITKENSNVYNKQIDLNESNQNDTLMFTATGEKLNGEQCYIMTDSQDGGTFKHVILQPTNLEEKSKKKIITTSTPTTTSSSHNRFMESNKKTYDFQNRPKKTYLKNKQASPTTVTANQIILNDANAFKTSDNQQIYIETQSPINQQTQLILADSNQLAALNSNIEFDGNTVSTIQALLQDGNQIIQTSGGEVVQIPLDQHQIIMQESPIVSTTPPNTNSNNVQTTIAIEQQNLQMATEAEQQVLNAEPDTNQYIMIQQPDGQCVQISIPEGMDVDEVIKNLNFTWQTDEPVAEQPTTETEQEQTSTQFLDTQQILGQQQLITDQQTQLITAEQQQILTDGQIQQLNLDPATVEQLQSGEQQVIYLPVNEDGTAIALDQESLNAMLLTNGEIPIIVSSSN